MAKGKNNKENTRKVKSDAGRDETPLQPLNSKQQDYINALYEAPVILCTGVWGSSKTYIPSVIACDLLLSKQIDKIIVARPSEGKGKSLGFFKGGKNEKLSGWVAPITDTFVKRLGEGQFEYFVENGKIELLALEQVKGRSWDDAFIIVDEAEDLDPSVAKSLVGRQGVRSTTVITGDINQQDLKEHSGLQTLLNVASHVNMSIPHIDFDKWEYCVRSEEAKQWGMAFESYEKLHGKIR